MKKAFLALVLIIGVVAIYGYFDNAASGQGSAPSRTDTGRPAQPGDGRNAIWYGRYTMCSDQSPDISLSCTGTITRARPVPRGAPQPYPPQLRPSRDGRFSGHQLDHHCRDLAVRLGRSGEQSGPLCTQEEAEEQARKIPVGTSRSIRAFPTPEA